MSRRKDGRSVTHVELNNTQRVIAIIMLAQVRLHGRDPNGSHALNLSLFTEEPQRQIDIVDTAVNEDTTRELGVGHEETTGVQLVACL